ncbi:MAG: 2-oxoglutarate and iron-dependent oxygenase domain-containing protein, partial [Candidatus Puniceispirillales bacterium]
MNVKTVDYHSSHASADLAESLRNTGFAVLVNHPITPHRIEEIYSIWAAFFADSSKHDWLRDPERQDGFFPFQSEHAKGSPAKDLKEFYHVYPWGRVPEDLEAFTRQLYADLTAIGIELLSWLDQLMPDEICASLSMPLQEMMQASQQSLLRILHYPPVSAEEDAAAIRAAAHEDINLITLLLAGSQPGLQARDKQGQWHDVPCDPGMITI